MCLYRINVFRIQNNRYRDFPEVIVESQIISEEDHPHSGVKLQRLQQQITKEGTPYYSFCK